jgi:hypothetical protein
MAMAGLGLPTTVTVAVDVGVVAVSAVAVFVLFPQPLEKRSRAGQTHSDRLSEGVMRVFSSPRGERDF